MANSTVRRFSAQYVFDGKTYHKLAILVYNETTDQVYLIPCVHSYKEQANVEFYNGVICYAPQKKSNIVLLTHYDFMHMSPTAETKEVILIHRKEEQYK